MSEKEKKRLSKKAIIAIAIAAVLLVAGAISAYFVIKYNYDQRLMEEERQKIIQSGTYLQGITINGVPVGGLTLDEAKELLLEKEDTYLSQYNLKLVYEDYSKDINISSFGMTANYDQVLQDAILYGKEGTYAEIQAAMKDLELNGHDFPLVFTPNKTYIMSVVQGIATDLNIEAKDAELKFEPKAEKIDDKIGYLDEVEGRAVDTDSLFTLVETRLNSKQYEGDIQIPVSVTMPTLTVEQLKEKITLRGQSSTSFATAAQSRETRVHNIKKGVNIINGTVLKPGETFSANKLLGDRTYANGWKPAPGYSGGKIQDEPGGGICQVSTTLYQAAVKADLQIVERRNHSMPVSYDDGGLDATLVSRTTDLKFKNTTNSDIIIIGYTEGKKVYFRIYGEPLPAEYDEIRLSAKKTATIAPPGEQKRVVDETKPVGYEEVDVERRSGSKWVSYKHYYKDGKLVRTVVLDYSTYRAYAGTLIVGPDATMSPSHGPSASGGTPTPPPPASTSASDPPAGDP